MRVLRQGDTSYTYGGRFTGPVQLEMLEQAQRDGAPDIARVHFDHGAVTNWHQHPGGQLLYLLSGAGRVGAADGTHTGLPPGTLVDTPPEESHWHGADDGSDAIWLAITWGATCWTDDAPV